MGLLKSLMVLEHGAGKISFSAEDNPQHVLHVEAKRSGQDTSFAFDLSNSEVIELSRFLAHVCGQDEDEDEDG